MRAPLPLVISLEKALAAYLQLDPDSEQKIQKLDGKLVALELRGLDMTLFFVGEQNKLSIRSVADETADAVISATPLMLAQMTVQKNADKALFAGKMKISGDLDCAQALQDILGDTDIDWEEHLSSLVGDVVAHQVGRGVRGLFNWASNSSSSLQEDLSEYLIHEVKLLPDAEDLENFLNKVDTIRSDIERFSIRLDRYEQTNKV